MQFWHIFRLQGVRLSWHYTVHAGFFRKKPSKAPKNLPIFRLQSNFPSLAGGGNPNYFSIARTHLSFYRRGFASSAEFQRAWIVSSKKRSVLKWNLMQKSY